MKFQNTKLPKPKTLHPILVSPIQLGYTMVESHVVLSQNQGYLCGGPYDTDYGVLGVYVGFPFFSGGNLPLISPVLESFPQSTECFGTTHVYSRLRVGECAGWAFATLCGARVCKSTWFGFEGLGLYGLPTLIDQLHSDCRGFVVSLHESSTNIFVCLCQVQLARQLSSFLGTKLASNLPAV